MDPELRKQLLLGLHQAYTQGLKPADADAYLKKWLAGTPHAGVTMNDIIPSTPDVTDYKNAPDWLTPQGVGAVNAVGGFLTGVGKTPEVMLNAALHPIQTVKRIGQNLVQAALVPTQGSDYSSTNAYNAQMGLPAVDTTNTQSPDELKKSALGVVGIDPNNVAESLGTALGAGLLLHGATEAPGAVMRAGRTGLRMAGEASGLKAFQRQAMPNQAAVSDLSANAMKFSGQGPVAPGMQPAPLVPPEFQMTLADVDPSGASSQIANDAGVDAPYIRRGLDVLQQQRESIGMPTLADAIKQQAVKVFDEPYRTMERENPVISQTPAQRGGVTLDQAMKEGTNSEARDALNRAYARGWKPKLATDGTIDMSQTVPETEQVTLSSDNQPLLKILKRKAVAQTLADSPAIDLTSSPQSFTEWRQIRTALDGAKEAAYNNGNHPLGQVLKSAIGDIDTQLGKVVPNYADVQKAYNARMNLAEEAGKIPGIRPPKVQSEQLRGAPMSGAGVPYQLRRGLVNAIMPGYGEARANAMGAAGTAGIGPTPSFPSGLTLNDLIQRLGSKPSSLQNRGGFADFAPGPRSLAAEEALKNLKTPFKDALGRTGADFILSPDQILANYLKEIARNRPTVVPSGPVKGLLP